MDIAFIIDDIDCAIGLEQTTDSNIVTLFTSSEIIIVMNINVTT